MFVRFAFHMNVALTDFPCRSDCRYVMILAPYLWGANLIDGWTAGRPLRGGRVHPARVQFRPVFHPPLKPRKYIEKYGEVDESWMDFQLSSTHGRPAFVHPPSSAFGTKKALTMASPNWSTNGRVLVSPLSVCTSADAIAFAEILCLRGFGFDDLAAY